MGQPSVPYPPDPGPAGPDGLSEADKADFEEVLLQALASPRIRAALGGGDADLRQLRLSALRARDRISAAAEPEHLSYMQRRASAEPMAGSRAAPPGQDQVKAALAVLVPVLAGMAAVLFLILGYGMRLAEVGRDLANTFVAVGWTAAGVTALALVVGGAAVLTTAVRNHPAPDAPEQDHSAQLEQARAIWHQALLERGILPFLLQGSGTVPGQAAPPSGEAGESGE